MNWPGTLSQSEPSIQSRQNHLINRAAAGAYNSSSSSYKVSIGHETVNIREMAPQRDPSLDPTATTITTVGSSERRRLISTRKGANVLSLCFMCFVSSSLILIAISTMHLLLKSSYAQNADTIPFVLQANNVTPGFLYVLATSMPISQTVTNLMVPIYDRTIRDVATVVCLSIVVLNCFCLLVFSIEIYLGCNMIVTRPNSNR